MAFFEARASSYSPSVISTRPRHSGSSHSQTKGTAASAGSGATAVQSRSFAAAFRLRASVVGALPGPGQRRPVFPRRAVRKRRSERAFLRSHPPARRSGGYRTHMRRAGGALLCLECGRESDGLGLGWRAYLAGGAAAESEDADDRLVVVCPDCARREFGSFDAGLREP
jgi:hypothetical protein